MRIEEVKAREILDSRGNPTVEVEVVLSDGTSGRASVPSGASRGKYEALELRDGDERYRGKGVLRAVRNVNEIIAPELKGLSPLDQALIDKILCELDGTEDKSNLGANAILPVSLAVARASANFLKIPLYRYIGGLGERKMPLPMMNILNGGKHAPGSADFQEFMIIPRAEVFSESLRMGVEVFYSLRELVMERGFVPSVGDEGGLTPILGSNREGLELLTLAVEKAGYKPGDDILFALDIAASEIFEGGKYILRKEGLSLSPEELVNYYEALIDSFPIMSIEDPLAEDDVEGWRLITEKLSSKLMLVGDDLFTTNPERLGMGIEKGLANSILIKPNQIGTLTETINTVKLAKSSGYRTIMSHRSGETDDDFIADLSVALETDFVKFGAPSRGERVSKYNRLLRIEEEMP